MATDTTRTKLNKKSQDYAFLAGGGEMGALIRSFDWSKTPLGPVGSWSQGLRTTISILLANRFPLLLWWGPDYIQLYNDPYRPVLGTKHPKSLGQPARECWPEIWDVIGPLIDTPFRGGPATWMDDISLEINRHGFMEETHFTIAYSPVPDEAAPNGIGGVLATVNETSSKVVGERRVLILRDLGANAAEAKSAEEACILAARTIAEHPKDIPFALFYLIGADGKNVDLAAASGVGKGEQISSLVVDLHEQRAEWPFAEALQQALRAETVQLLDNLGARFSDVPPGPWSDPPSSAVVIPIRSNRAHEFVGFLIAGISSRLKFDDQYRGFFELLTTQIATSIANARAYEEERKRAEALAEIDRAKTTFFSNVSHEFRTPLTLMLGPIEDALRDVDTNLVNQERMDVAHRNALRLLKLVNTLLDFSRIEAGRMQAVYEAIDLASYSAELTSGFRSAIEKAGMELVVDCPPLSEPVYVDREMWEKIVLNLLSNAFKYTLEGRITVSLLQKGEIVELSVQDTGVGIPEHELPHIFERFHRVQGSEGRSYEGTGIGLSLVQELVRLHGGSISVQSERGKGSTFKVAIPMGTAHLPKDHLAERTLASTALGTKAYVDEALRWLPGPENMPDIIPDAQVTEVAQYIPPSPNGDQPGSNGQGPHHARILLADDNADMREYVNRLLGDRYQIAAVADGREALAIVRHFKPDLVITDVMMPNIDGFALLRALRDDPDTSSLPVIMLSARAGEKSRIEGMQAGADDYLIKPFSARELLACVGAHLEIARVRKEAARVAEAERQRLYEVFMQAPAIVVVLRGSNHVIEFANPTAMQALRLGRDAIGKPLPAALPEVESRILVDLLDTVYTTGEPFIGDEIPLILDRHGDGRLEEVYYNFVYQPYRDPDGKVQGVLVHAVDVSSHVVSRREIEVQSALLETLFENLPVAITYFDTDMRVIYANALYEQLLGTPRNAAIGRIVYDVSPVARERRSLFERALAGETHLYEATPYQHPDGSTRYYEVAHIPVKDDGGRVIGLISTIADVTEQKRNEKLLVRQAGLLEQSHDAIFAWELGGPIVYWNEGAQELYGYTKNQAMGVISHTLLRTLHLEGRDIVEEALQRDGQWEGELVHITHEGKRIIVESRHQLIHEPGGRSVVLEINRDITDRKQAEETLRASEIRLRTFAQADIVGVVTATLDGRILEANDAFLRMIRYTRTDLQEGRLRWDRLTPPAYREVSQAISNELLSKGSFGPVENAYTRKDSSEVPVLISGAMVNRDSSEAIILVLDITERKKLEQRKDEFIALASHELKTPITALKMSAQLLQRRLRKEQPRRTENESALVMSADDYAAKQLSRIDEQLNRLTDLVDDLLDVSKVEAGKLDFHMDETDAGILIRDCIEDLRLLSVSHTIVVEGLASGRIICDKDRIGQVLTNLITNAIKFSPQADRIIVSSRPGDKSIQVSVQDFGIGIPESDQDKIFDRFFQVRSLEAGGGTYPGLGLGLYISSQIVKRHGGKIWVESEQGRGSIFYFTLPLASSAPFTLQAQPGDGNV